MRYEYYGYTIDIPMNLYLFGTDEEIEDHCLNSISEIDYSNNIDEIHTED